MFIGCVTAITVILFFISLVAFQRSSSLKAGALGIALGLFALKNIVITILYLRDEMPDITVLMFADVLIAGSVLAGMAKGRQIPKEKPEIQPEE